MQNFDHAVSCGVNMIGLKAVEPRHFPRGVWPANDILHPETRAVIWPKGYWMTKDDALKLAAETGIDYVICE